VNSPTAKTRTEFIRENQAIPPPVPVTSGAIPLPAVAPHWLPIFQNQCKNNALQMERIANQTVTETRSIIAHETICQHPASREILIHPQIRAELFLLLLSEYLAPIHHPRDAMVYHGPLTRVLPWCQPACMSHRIGCGLVVKIAMRQNSPPPSASYRILGTRSTTILNYFSVPLCCPFMFAASPPATTAPPPRFDSRRSSPSPPGGRTLR